ncbi:FUN14 family-domain-containing protein [Pilaira anomala]|nr:FUN14 family-domain-containing protein [Pilaira anomala]
MLRLPRVLHTVRAYRPSALVNQQTRQFSVQNKIFATTTPVKSVFQNQSKAFGASKIITLAAFTSATTPLLFKQPVQCQAGFATESPLRVDNSTHIQNKSIFNKGELTFGTFLGICTGFLVKKVGKIFAAFVGTGFVFLQYLSQQGYVTVHWDRLEGGYNKALDVDKDGKVTRRDLQSNWQKFINVLTNNIQFKSTFMVGFYVGMRYG